MSYSHSDDHHASAEHIYYNVGINADHSPTNPTIKEARFIDTRGQIIVDKPSEFTLNVLNFTCPTDAVPILIYPNTGNEGSRVVDNTQYSITLQHSSQTVGPLSQVFLQFQPESFEFPSTTEAYYHVKDYFAFIDMINQALSTAYTNLALGATPPFLELDPVTKLVSLYVKESDAATPLYVFMNPKLFHMFTGFENKNYPLQSYTDGKFALISYNANKSRNNIVSISGTDYIKQQQQYPCLYQWNDLQSIVITSSLIPLRTEYVPGDSDNTSTAINDNTLKIVSSFTPVVEDGTSLKQGITYLPEAEYKRIDMQGNSPLQLFDLSVSWIDKRNEIHQLYLSPYSQPVIVKILFERK